MDIVGNAFDENWPTLRSTWFPLTKKQHQRMHLPPIEGRDMPKPGYPCGKVYGQCSSNSIIMLCVMQALSDAYPTRLIDVPDAIVSCIAARNLCRENDQDPIDKLVSHHKRPFIDNGLAVPVGLAVGYYAATADLLLDVVGTLARAVSGVFGLSTAQSRTALAIALLSWSLADSGYFCEEDIRSLVELGALSEDALPYVDMLRENALSETFFNEFWNLKTQPGFFELHHSEQVLIRTMFFMLRVSTQYKEDHIVFSTVPKEQLNEVFDDVRLGTDTAFLFGGLVTLSEQTGEGGCYKLLIPENLVTESPYSRTVSTTFKDIKGI